MSRRRWEIAPFGRWLMRALDDAHMTQRDLASATGIAESTIPEWKYGRSLPRPEQVDILAKSLRVRREDVYRAMGWLQDDTGYTLSPLEREKLDKMLAMGRDQQLKLLGLMEVLNQVHEQRESDMDTSGIEGEERDIP